MAENRGRPKKDPTKRLEIPIGLRVKNDLAALLDQKATELESQQPGSTWSRSDVVRYMLYKAFKDEEQ